MEPMSTSDEDNSFNLKPNIADLLPESPFRDGGSQSDRDINGKLESTSSDLMAKFTGICHQNSIPDLIPEMVEVKEEMFYCQHCSHSDVAVNRLKVHMLNQHPTKPAVFLNSLLEESQNDISDVTFFCVRESCTYVTSICYVYEDHLMSCCSQHNTSISETERKKLEASVKFLLAFHRKHGFKTPSRFLEFVTTNSNTSVSTSTIFEKDELPEEKPYTDINDKRERLGQDTIPQQIQERDSTTNMNHSSIHSLLLESKKSSSDPLHGTLSSQNKIVYMSEDKSFYVTENKDISASTTSGAMNYEKHGQDVNLENSRNSNTIHSSENVQEKAPFLAASHYRDNSMMFERCQSKSEFLGGCSEKDCFCDIKEVLTTPRENVRDGDVIENGAPFDIKKVLRTLLRKKVQERVGIAEETPQGSVSSRHQIAGDNPQTPMKPVTASEAVQFDDPNECGNLDIHMSTNEGVNPLSCLKCYKSFRFKSHLYRHMLAHIGEKPYKCYECGEIFNVKSDLLMHMRTHKEEKEKKCNVCGKIFTRIGHLNRHMRTHAEEIPYKCDECGKLFRRKGNFTTHMKTHTGDKPYQCYEFDKNFIDDIDNCALPNHLRTHTGEKPYKCNECGKSFSDSSNQRQQMRTLTGEKAYKCNECGKSFIENSALHKHENTLDVGKAR